jgi:hypothetical protein
MLLIVRHLCAVCDTDAAARNVQTRGGESIFFCWYGITLPKQAKNGKKKRDSAETREKWQKKAEKGQKYR